MKRIIGFCAALSGINRKKTTRVRLGENGPKKWKLRISAGLALALSLPLAGYGAESAAVDSIASAVQQKTDVVVAWSKTSDIAIGVAARPAGLTARYASITSIAMFEALNGVKQKYLPIHISDVAPDDTRADPAAVQAAYVTLKALYPGQEALFDQARTDTLASIPGDPNDPSFQRGLAWGDHVAHEILDWRATDGTVPFPGYTLPAGFPGSTELGVWRPIVGTAPAILPQLAVMASYGLNDCAAAPCDDSTLRPPAPPALTSALYAQDVNETAVMGRATGSGRTQWQSDTADFWGKTDVVRPLDGIARELFTHGMQPIDEALVFSALHMAMMDSQIATWDAKVAYDFWRPFHAIRLADQDGNDLTTVDPTWTPYLPTPNHQEYPSGHSASMGAAVAVLQSFFGDVVVPAYESVGKPGQVRSAPSLSALVDEMKDARVFGGMHFRNSNNVGAELGREAALRVLAKVTAQAPAHRAVAENKAPSVIGCPVARYPVRTGKDYDANLVDLSSFVFTTVAAMRSWPVPSIIPFANRISPYETTVLALDATLVEYQLDRDSDNSDYRLTLADELGNTIVARIASWTCAAFEDRVGEPGSELPPSRFLAGIEIARDEFAARFSPTTKAQSANIRVRIMGIGMFNYLSGMTTGEAPNGIELSPVLDILFDETRMPITRVPVPHHPHDARLTDPP